MSVSEGKPRHESAVSGSMLDALSDVKPKHESAVIRLMLDEIEAALARGLTREQVHKAICEQHQLSIGYNGFLSAVARERKARGRAKPQAVTGARVDQPAQVMAPAAPPTASAQPQTPEPESTAEPEVPVNQPPVDVASALLDMKTNGLPKSEVSDESTPIYVSKRNRNK